MSGWILITLIASAVLAGAAGYVRLRWQRSPAAFQAMLAVGAACAAAGFLLGIAAHHALSARPPERGVTPPAAPAAVIVPPASILSDAARAGAAVAGALGSLASQRQFGAQVMRIVDGDTVDVTGPDHAYHAIRLEGIDAPEHGQAFGRRSTEHLAGLISGRSVTLDCDHGVSYQRLICKILLPDGEDVCLDQIKSGMAWHYKQYQDEQSPADRQVYAAAECAAMKARIGLWSDPHPVEPQDFRHHTDSPLLLGSDGCRTTSEPTSGGVLGNARSRIFEWPGCPYYGAISSQDQVRFASPQAAEAAGYQPARNCP